MEMKTATAKKATTTTNGEAASPRNKPADADGERDMPDEKGDGKARDETAGDTNGCGGGGGGEGEGGKE